MVLAVASRFSDPQWATHGGGLAFTALALGSACCTVLDSAVNGASSSPVQLAFSIILPWWKTKLMKFVSASNGPLNGCSTPSAQPKLCLSSRIVLYFGIFWW
mmetsp:Transcript_79085/g.124849  ORF Transcript_79085/g.124849 Transcript_79085/m.124849 type:complete len:102 (+) Transcript_79085:155-460(+)